MEHLLAIIIAVILDYFIGDPRWLPHPVRGMGMLISYLDRRFNDGEYRKLNGILTLFIVCLVAYAVSFTFIHMSYQLSTVLGIIVESIVIFTTIATKSLKDAAYEVYIPLKQGDLVSARKQLSMIVGRDTEQLDEGEVVRGCVETVAENISDGITAPLFFALIGGGTFAFVYRAVNTCDAMLGYKNETYIDFGWASARFDDLLNFLPARITAFMIIFANVKLSPFSLKQCLKLLFRDAKKHPSPNSGWGEAAMAALLGVQLGGVNTYKGVVSVRPKLGEPLVNLRKEHICDAVNVMVRTVVAFIVLLCLGGILIEFAVTWS
ncbi:adenosylcobinamide-phosphate synthase CbiB [Paranoxybacillus vitaminiphilus]|nr:adenosylcobinamide-phosphate synthase CbiB [Anoxybacillus vitaminiphilus]